MSNNFSELQAFLNELGFPDHFEMFCKNQITTLTALKNLEQDDIEEMGCLPFVAKIIVKALNRMQSQSTHEQKPELAKGQSLDVVLYKTEIQGLKKDFECDQKFTALEHQLQVFTSFQ